jgi:fatty acid-binding protein DegV
MPEGARRVGVARNREEQLHFAMKTLGCSLQTEEKALIMLEYSDNRPWEEEFRNDVAKSYPKARINVHPLSLTSGVHMGPGTWAVAFLPDIR